MIKQIFKLSFISLAVASAASTHAAGISASCTAGKEAVAFELTVAEGETCTVETRISINGGEPEIETFDVPMSTTISTPAADGVVTSGEAHLQCRVSAGSQNLSGFATCDRTEDDEETPPTTEPTPTPAPEADACLEGAINFTELELVSFGDQDITGTTVTEDNGCTLAMTGNTWKFTDFEYTLTPNTVLVFDFMSSAEGEIQGILFDTTNPETGNGGRTFQVHGTQDWGIRDFTYTGAGEYQTIEIPVGAYLSGSMSIGFASDDDANTMSESYFRNVRLIEQ